MKLMGVATNANSTICFLVYSLSPNARAPSAGSHNPWILQGKLSPAMQVPVAILFTCECWLYPLTAKLKCHGKHTASVPWVLHCGVTAAIKCEVSPNNPPLIHIHLAVCCSLAWAHSTQNKWQDAF